MHKNGLLTGGLLGLSLLMGSAQATLINNGDDTVTDTSTGLMWTKNANLALTNQFGLTLSTDEYVGTANTVGSTGRMTWDNAKAWIAGMNAANYKGHNDWRLPIVIDTDGPDADALGNDGCDFAYSGTDCGYNVDTGTGELAYLFHDILGNTSYYDADGDIAGSVDYDGTCSTSDPYCLQNTSADGVTFDFLQSDHYWSGTEYAPYTDLAWLFYTTGGGQGFNGKISFFYGWAVRSGNVAVPEPGMVLLMGMGLAGLLGVGRRQRRR